MTDLQCPATIVLIPSESLGSSVCEAVLAGKRLAGQFDESTTDPPTLRRAVDALADLYRGETIALVANAAALRELFGADDPVDAPIVVNVDGSGWTVVPRDASS